MQISGNCSTKFATTTPDKNYTLKHVKNYTINQDSNSNCLFHDFHGMLQSNPRPFLYTHYLDHDNSPFLVKSCDTFHSKF